MKIIRSLPLLAAAIAALASSPVLHAEDSTDTITPDGVFEPKVYGKDRYEKLKSKSPFEFELPKADAQVVADPFEGLSLAGFVGTDPNKATVYLASEKDKTQITVFGNASVRKRDDKTGFRIVEVKPGKKRAESVVVIEKNGATKEIGYKEGYLYSIKAGGVAAGAPGQPQPNGQPGIVRPGGPGQGGPQNAMIRQQGNFQAGGTMISGQPAATNLANNGGGAGGPMISRTPNPQAAAQVNEAAAQAVLNATLPQNNGTPQINPAMVNPGNGMNQGGGRGDRGGDQGVQRRRVVLPSPTPPPNQPVQPTGPVISQ